MAIIRANRESIDDRFSVLGFTVRTEDPLFEVGLATDPDLLRSDNRQRRTTGNFFSSHILSAGASSRGEAVYLVPPNVVARFVGQPRLYFGLATYREGDRTHPVSVRIPDRGNMYVSLSGLTERGLRRTARINGSANGYGQNGADVGWGGDAVVSSSAPAAAGAAKTNGAAKSNGGGATAPSAAAEPAPYSDGYSDDLWKQRAGATTGAATQAPAASAAPAPTAPAAAPSAPATSPSAPAMAPSASATAPSAPAAAPPVTAIAPSTPAPGVPATAQSYAQQASSGFGTGMQRKSPPGRTAALAKPLLVSSYYQPTNLLDALRTQISFFVQSAMWYLGVGDTTVMPHSAICQVRRPDGSDEGALHGSGFFIGPRLILTAAHVVDGQSELIVVPGKNGGGVSGTTEPFGRFRVSTFRKHPSYVAGNEDFDMGLICVPEANASSNYFDLVEELTQSRPEGVVVSGYAARWYANDAIERFVNETIDPNKQHMMGGYIRTLPTDETFDYDLQTLGGTSGSPVYWLEDAATPRAHLVGVHVAAHSATTNLGCRITPAKLAWIRSVAAEFSQAVTFSLGIARSAGNAAAATRRPIAAARSSALAASGGTRNRAYAHAQAGDASGRFVWPPGLAGPITLAQDFLDSYNARVDNVDDDRVRFDVLNNYVPRIADSLQSDASRAAVSEAILEITTAASMQVIDLIKDRLPASLYAPISTDAANPPPAPGADVTMPRLLPYFSRRMGMYMAWVDTAIQRAKASTAERLRLQKQHWDGMREIVGVASTLAGFIPGLGEASAVFGVVVDRALAATEPDFDRPYASFATAMQTVRQNYQAVASSVLRGLIQARTTPNMSVDLPLHPDVQAFLDAHAAHALLGWQEELAFLGIEQVPAAQSLGVVGRRVARALEVITPFYDPADPSSALTCQNDAFSLAREEWFAGVPNTTLFPHSAICQLNMTAPDGSMYGGTGFYIGANRILTCAHNLSGMSSVQIIPGRNGAGGMPFGQCSVNSSSWRVAPGYTGSGNWDNDLAVIDNVPIAAPNGQWFGFLQQTPSDRLPVAVCGYSAQSDAVPGLTDIIDGDMQHLHGGYIRGQSNLEVIEYPILTLHGASGSPVYSLSGSGASLQALVCGVHVTGQPAAQGLNRGCFITPRKIDWIEGRATSFALAVRSRALDADEDSAHGIDGPIPDDVATAQSLAAVTRTRALDAPSPEYPQASRFAAADSGNYRAVSGTRAIERVVIHITDGGANINGTIGWFQNPSAKVSAHYVVGQDGEVVQMVRHNDVAWHARSANGNSIGIEHVANTRGLRPTPAQLAASAALVSWLCDQFGIAVDRTHVLGHSEADPGTTHSGCPNAVWDWTYYMGLITSRSSYAPATAQALRPVRALEAQPSDYPVTLIPQPDKNSCWAASMAMLLSWRRNASFAPETLANDVGASLASSYDWDLLNAVRTRYGFEMIQQPSNTSLYHTPQQWADWLGQYGPLWVVIVGAPHAVVLAGIRGNLADVASAQVKLLNPWDTRISFDNDPIAFNPPNRGYQDWISFQQFASDFGNMAQPDYGNWRVLYLPEYTAIAQSLGTGGRLRLARPPAPIRAFSLEDAAAPAGETREPIEPTRVAGTRMSVVRGRAGASSWALDQLEGLKAPAAPGTTVSSSPGGDVSIEIGGWPAIEGEASPLPLTVRFRTTAQGAVGDVQIGAGTPANLAYGVDVTARIDNDSDAGPVAALKVGIDYRFRGLAQGAPSARIDLRLLGDGRWERVNRWLTNIAAA